MITRRVIACNDFSPTAATSHCPHSPARLAGSNPQSARAGRLSCRPVFDAWAGYLYHAGQTAMLVRPTRSAGDIDLLTVDLDIDAWTRLITGGIEQNVIMLPITS